MGSQNVAPKRRATAVIAVHGVCDQKPFETARAIGDMLQDLALKPRDPTNKQPQCANPGPEDPRYYPFHEQGLRINVNPVVMSGGGTARSSQSMRGPFNAWVQERLKRVQTGKKKAPTVRIQEDAVQQEVKGTDLHTES